jgi:heptosyltransferase-2
MAAMDVVSPYLSTPSVSGPQRISKARPGSGDDNAEVPPRAWSKTRRVLVKEVNWLGDLVLSLPALRVLRAAFAGAALSVLVRQELAGFFDGIQWVDEVIPYTLQAGIRGWGDQRRIIAAVRARRLDLAVIFPNSFRSALWAMLARVPYRAGYATDGRRCLLTHHTVPQVSAMKGHQSQYWLSMVSGTLGIPPALPDSLPYRVEVSPQTVGRMRQWLASHRRNRNAPLIALSSAAAYGPAKEWPSIYYSRLIDLLSGHSGAECVLLGTAAERKKCEQLAAMSRMGAIVAAGDTDVAELKALLSLCNGFAGNDSGAMHLAAALGIPSVGIFGSTNPARTGPVGPKATSIYHPVTCSPCLKRTCRFGHYQCLRGIEPSEIASALTELGAFATACW